MKNRKLEKTPITIILSLMILFGVFTATSNNAYAQSKDINDVKAIQKIITIQQIKVKRLCRHKKYNMVGLYSRSGN